LGLAVAILDVNPQKLQFLKGRTPPQTRLLLSERAVLEAELKKADLIVGAVLVPGARTPKVVSRDQLKLVKKGSVVVDVAIDQGGCFETSRMTTHSQPVYAEEGVIHYCVGNMPGAYPRSAAIALSEVTLPYGLELANRGLKGAILARPALLSGVNAYDGFLAVKPVAEAFGLMGQYRENPLA
jgi:alanine dehydrogenase